MWLFNRIKIKFKYMLKMSKHVKVDSKFIVIIFFLCLVPICISSFYTGMSSTGNMTTIRTMFSAILGYLIENITPSQDKQINMNIKKVDSQLEEQGNIMQQQEDGVEDMPEPEEKESLTEEVRILIVGHILILITIILIIGVGVPVEQNNQSLVLLRNTAFSCIGYLVSAANKNDLQR